MPRYEFPRVGVALTTVEERAELREKSLKRDRIQTRKSTVKPRMIARVA